MTSLALVPAVAGFAVLLITGLPIWLCLTAICAGWLLLNGDDPSLPLSQVFWSYNKADLVAIPFFVLSAEILTRSGATAALVAAADLWFGRIRNGLAVVTLFSIMVFSAISGSSVATAMAVGRIMIPELIAAGYRPRFAYGLVAAAGGLGIIIPPSVPLIVYASVAEVSVGDVFVAALGPGLMLGLAIGGYILVAGDHIRTPGHRAETSRRLSQRAGARRAITLRGLPMLLFPVIILGGIYLGIVTATEAAALSVVLSLLFSVTIYREASLRKLWDQAIGAGGLAASILLMMGASVLLSYIISANRVPATLAAWITEQDISALGFLFCVTAFLILLGLFLEVISVILIVTPIVLPTLVQMGVDPIQFAMILILSMELAVITPPVGMNLFVVSSIVKAPIAEVFRGCLPFIAIVALVISALIVSPEVALISLDLLGD